MEVEKVVFRVTPELKKSFIDKLHNQGKSAVYVGEKLIRKWVEGEIILSAEDESKPRKVRRRA